MNNDRSLDHLIYDGMGYAQPDGCVIGSVRPTGKAPATPVNLNPDTENQTCNSRSNTLPNERPA